MSMNANFIIVQLEENVVPVMEYVVTQLETGPVFVRQAMRQATIVIAIFRVMVSFNIFIIIYFSLCK